MGMIHVLGESVIFTKRTLAAQITGINSSFSKSAASDELYLQQNVCMKVHKKFSRKCFLACKFSVIPAEGSLSSRKLGVWKE